MAKPKAVAEPKWKRFERLVAALHHSFSNGGAQIEWNDAINKRQFDITIRFAYVGYHYLTLIECKDYRVPVKEIEAFVTKSRRARANKASVFSSSGFQSGCIDVARDENIELYTLAESDRWPTNVRVVQRVQGIILSDLEVLGAKGGVAHRFPSSPSALSYFATHVVVTEPQGTSSLDDVVARDAAGWQRRLTKAPRRRILKLEQPATVTVPHVDPISASAIRFTARSDVVLTLDAGGADPSVLPRLFSFKNEVTGEQKFLDATDLWVGFDTTITVDTFYINPMLGFVYYCEAISDEGLADYVLIESYQHGMLVQAAFRQYTKYGRYLVPVIDDTEVKRLTRMYNYYRRDRAQGA